jgi:cytochrome c
MIPLKTTQRSLSLAAALAVAPFVTSAAEPNTLTSAEAAAGWKLLFDGKTLDGWRGFATDGTPTNWKVENGALVWVARGGDLVTKEMFGDFELSLEWKVAKGANSGIIYRSGLGEKAPWHTGPEYQILDNIDGADNKIESHRAGSLYDLIAAGPDVTKPVGEWNLAKVVVKGWRVEHWLNGKKLLEADLASPEGKAMIAGSKFKPQAKFATLTEGHIVLQDHGDVVYYRSVKVRAVK